MVSYGYTIDITNIVSIYIYSATFKNILQKQVSEQTILPLALDCSDLG